MVNGNSESSIRIHPVTESITASPLDPCRIAVFKPQMTDRVWTPGSHDENLAFVSAGIIAVDFYLMIFVRQAMALLMPMNQ